MDLESIGTAIVVVCGNDAVGLGKCVLALVHGARFSGPLPLPERFSQRVGKYCVAST